jgi:hypothetical protein
MALAGLPWLPFVLITSNRWGYPDHSHRNACGRSFVMTLARDPRSSHAFLTTCPVRWIYRRVKPTANMTLSGPACSRIYPNYHENACLGPDRSHIIGSVRMRAWMRRTLLAVLSRKKVLSGFQFPTKSISNIAGRYQRNVAG